MSEPLLPERPVQFSSSLATVIGLEEAILLQHIQLRAELGAIVPENLPRQFEHKNYQWIRSSFMELAHQLPFWEPSVIRRIANSLRELGMLVISNDPKSADTRFYCAITQSSPSQKSVLTTENAAQASAPLGAQKLSQHWQPDTATIAYLDNLAIPASFIQATVEEFVLYWRERNESSHAWGSKFAQHVARRWQSEQQLIADREQRAAAKHPGNQQSGIAIQQEWQPSIDAIEILERMGIHKNFIIDAIPEFILYWRERGDSQNTWNSKFVAHTKRQWARYTNTLKHDTEPRPISEQWRPDEEVFEVLTLANIDREFAVNLVAEFVMYWRDRGELHHSWNTKFLQYVKYQWSKQYITSQQTTSDNSLQSQKNENHRSTTRPRKTRDRSLAEDLLDRSWAN